jgi:regulatory protein
MTLMVITGLRKRRGRLLQIEFDSIPDVILDIRTFEESSYEIGSSLSEEQLDDLINLSNQRRSREKALYLLSLRDHSRKELEKKLQRETDSITAEATAARMEELGLINDDQFAKNRARDLINRKLYPSRRAVQELCALGVNREIAQNAVDSLECDDVQQALALLKKKYYNRTINKDNYRKMAAALSRYGFSGDAIRRALNEFTSIEQGFEFND